MGDVQGDLGRKELAAAIDAYLSRTPSSPPPTNGESRTPASDESLASAYQAVVGSQESRPIIRPPVSPAPTDGKQQLSRAYDDVVEHEASKPKAIRVARPERWRRYVQPLIIVGGLGFILYAWTARPGWLFGRPDPSGAEPVGRPDRTLVAVDLLIQRFEAERGRLPASLDELGIVWPNVSLIPTGPGVVEVVFRAQGRSIVLSHRTGATPVVGESR
jgi:hypothetical protein